ncbi:MAG TPA: hypothetical protein DHU96_31590 [Actinobacteria bacterium]|nr:hypothetical protein [Actinomycetota bacterium]
MRALGRCRSDDYVEGKDLRAGVVVAGISSESKGDGREAVAFGLFSRCCAAAVDVQGRHAMVPVSVLNIVEQFHPQQAHMVIVLRFPLH